MKSLLVGTLLVFAIGLQSCVSVQPIGIEVVHPAQTTIAPEIKSISVINHAMSPNSDELNNYYKLDSTLAWNLILNVGSLIGESPRFTAIIDNEVLYYRKSSSNHHNLPWSDINDIISEDSTDAVMSLENIAISDTLIKWSYYDGMGYYSQKDFFLNIETTWKYYIPNINKVYFKTFNDTLNFNEIASIVNYNNLVNDKAGRDWIASQIANSHYISVANHVAPYWAQEYRYYYKGGYTELKRAHNYISKGDFDRAFDLLKNNSEVRNKRLAAYSAYNLAVLSEMQNKLEEALVWINKSLELRYFDNSAKYMRLLQDRKEQEEVLDKQFGL